jgi:nicotinamidase-related amidase
MVEHCSGPPWAAESSGHGAREIDLSNITDPQQFPRKPVPLDPDSGRLAAVDAIQPRRRIWPRRVSTQTPQKSAVVGPILEDLLRDHGADDISATGSATLAQLARRYDIGRHRRLGAAWFLFWCLLSLVV